MEDNTKRLQAIADKMDYSVGSVIATISFIVARNDAKDFDDAINKLEEKYGINISEENENDTNDDNLLPYLRTNEDMLEVKSDISYINRVRRRMKNCGYTNPDKLDVMVFLEKEIEDYKKQISMLKNKIHELSNDEVCNITLDQFTDRSIALKTMLEDGAIPQKDYVSEMKRIYRLLSKNTEGK